MRHRLPLGLAFVEGTLDRRNDGPVTFEPSIGWRGRAFQSRTGGPKSELWRFLVGEALGMGFKRIYLSRDFFGKHAKKAMVKLSY